MRGIYSYRAAFKRFVKHPLGITFEDHLVQEEILRTSAHELRLAKRQAKEANA